MKKARFHLIGAVSVILIKNNKIFLQKRINTGWGDGKYCLIGGHLNGGETAREAAIRETAEEAGVKVSSKDLKFFNVSHVITNAERIHFAFVVNKWKGEPKNNEPEKSSESGWFPIDKLPSDILEISKSTIDWYRNKITYSEFGWDKK